MASENPFAAFGTIATAGRFVGRSQECARLEERVIAGAGSAAVIGIARIGKSSLAAEVLNRIDGCQRPAIWLDLSTYESAAAFFNDWAERLGGEHLQPAVSTHAAFRRLHKLLQAQTRAQGGRLPVVIDEFDAVRGFNDASDFMRLLRELLYDPERTGVTAVLCSRREIARLELETQDISTLAGVLDHISLKPLGDPEMGTFFARSPKPISEPLRDAISQLAGGHPFLLEMCLATTLASDGDADLPALLQSVASRYYESLIKFLDAEKLLLETVQCAVGPRVRTDRVAAGQLLRYGVLDPSGQAFTSEFGEMLALVSLDADLWGLFGEVESGLRLVIEEAMCMTYGHEWLARLATKHKAIKALVHQAEELRTADAAKFPVATTASLLRYTYPAQLRDLIQCEWESFKPILGQNLAYWRPRLELLARVRAPFAHSRGDVVPDSDVRLAEIYCREILAIVQRS